MTTKRSLRSSFVILAIVTWAARQQKVDAFPTIHLSKTPNLQQRHLHVSFPGTPRNVNTATFDFQTEHCCNSRTIYSQRQPSHPTTSSSSSALFMSRWKGTEDVQGADVLKSCIPYLLPLLDGEHFGKYIYQQVPPLGFLDSLFIGPLSEFYDRVPFLGLILFVALTLGTRMNTDMNWTVRFNAQQAALIDVALVFPELIGSAFEGDDLPRYIEAPCMNFVWYTYMAMILYSIWSNVVLQKKPDQIPWISAYATTMTGPI